MGDSCIHHVTLQRLDVPVPYADGDVFFSRESFVNTSSWSGIPVIFGEVVDGTIHHPDAGAVASGRLPEGQKFCGYIDHAGMPAEGQPRLDAALVLTDPAVEAAAKLGKLGLSTGFTADTVIENGMKRLDGPITPNHVFVFEQGACPVCYPRDNGALFLNLQENSTEMTEEIDTADTKSMIQRIHDKVFSNNEETVSELKAALSERDARIAELEAAMKKQHEDTVWENMKQSIPEGWLGEHEPETRDLFENNKDKFYQKLMAHRESFVNTKAEGSACVCEQSNPLESYVADMEARTGLRF